MKHFAYISLIIWFVTTLPAHAQYEYTLKQCLEEGLFNNYSLRISRNEEQISKNNATLANAGYLPTIDLTAGYTGNIDNTNSTQRNDGSVVKERNVFDQTLDAGVDLNWTIFDGFNISTTYKELKELERQGETNTRITLEDFIAGLTAEYYNYVQQEIRLKNFLYAVSLSKERLRIVEERYHIGKFFPAGLSTSQSGLQCRQCTIYETTGTGGYLTYQPERVNGCTGSQPAATCQ